uniref:CHCH domain-containing protein n=1 Tax=Caenorhabditis tropicalis TaxID=1561998 RepID=A0A1I7T3V4_9PELO
MYCQVKDEILFIGREEFEKPIESEWIIEMKNTEKYKPNGPIFPDGSINWQCPCMAGGSLVAHRCGNYFRELYICMKSDDKRDPSEKCPNEFVNWAACMQNMSDERREQMRKAMTQDSEELKINPK